MDERTREALEASIKHWEHNAKVKRFDDIKIGPKDCALCGLFNRPETPFIDTCIGCPVYESTLQHACAGSPYDNVDMALLGWERGRKGAALAFRQAAQAELDFLISLRPKP